MRECDPPKAGVLGPVFEAIARLKSMTPLDKDPVRQMSAWSYHLSGILSLNNLAGGFPALRPYVGALEAGESIRASLQMQFSKTMRRAGALKAEESRAITRIMEVEDAEGRLATENADGTATITPSRDLVGSKKGETLTLSKELNEVRRSMRAAIDDTYTYMIQATKAAMGYMPGDKVPPKDQKVLDLMEAFRRKGYIPHIRPGSWGVQYTLGGTRHFETFSFDLSRGLKGSGRSQAVERIAELRKMGATDITPPLDIKSRREMIDRYLPKLSTIGKMDILFQSILSRPPKTAQKGEATAEIRKIFDMLRKEAAAKNPRLRERKGDPGWLTEANYDTYLRGMFAPFIASTSDWIANTATRNLREKAIADLGEVDGRLQSIAQSQEDYLHSDEALVAQLKSVAFLYTLGGNISSALVNLTQPMHTSLPFLGGVGGAGNAARQLARAYREVGLTVQTKFNPDEILRPEKLPPDVRPVIEEMFRRGVAEALLTRDQAPAALTATQSKAMYALGRGTGKVLEAASYAFSTVEQMNRVAVAIAAYRMAQDPKILKTFQDLGQKVGRDVRDATDAAEFAIRETQFVTSKPYRGRYMHGMIGGVGLQFMSFPIQMLGFINRAARYYGGEGIFKSPEGRRVLGLMALGIFATAGLWGMPFAGPAGDSLDWLSRQLGPSLGLSPIQTRVFLRDTLKEVFKDVPSLGFMGTPGELADMVMYGPARATGIDISKRTALDIIQFNPFQFDIYDFGPLGGAVAGGIRDALNYKSKGEDMMAVASLFPLAVRNIARAVTMRESGYITPGKFEPVLPASKVSDPETFVKVAMGFRPTKVSEAAEARRDTEEKATALDSVRTGYSDKIATAMVKSMQAGSPEERQSYLRQAQDLRREVTEYDRGRPLLERIVRDPVAFQSSIQEKIKKMRTPQRLEAVPPAARPYYAERLRENFREGGSVPDLRETMTEADIEARRSAASFGQRARDAARYARDFKPSDAPLFDDTGYERGTVLPVRRNIETGAMEFATPGLIAEPLNAMQRSATAMRSGQQVQPGDVAEALGLVGATSLALPGSLTRVPAGALGAMKPRGGNWLTETVDDSLSSVIRHPDVLKQRLQRYRERGKEDEIRANRFEEDVPISEWIHRNYKNYILRDMGTPDDPVRKAIDEGVTFGTLMPDDSIRPIREIFEKERLKGRRQAEGFPPEGYATTPEGKMYETVTDEIIDVARREDFLPENVHGSRFVDPYEKGELGTITPKRIPPWIEKTKPETKINVLGNQESRHELGTFLDITQSLIDTLQRASYPDSGLPGNLTVSPEKMKYMSVPDVLRLADDISAWRQAEADKALKAALRESNLVKELPDFDFAFAKGKGGAWVELPPAVDEKGVKICTSIGSAGGWCTMQEKMAVHYGKQGKVFALLDGDGRPHIQISSVGPDIEEIKFPENSPRSERSKSYEKKDKEYIDKVSKAVIDFLNGRELGYVNQSDIRNLSVGGRPIIDKNQSYGSLILSEEENKAIRQKYPELFQKGAPRFFVAPPVGD